MQEMEPILLLLIGSVSATIHILHPAGVSHLLTLWPRELRFTLSLWSKGPLRVALY